MYIFDYSGGLLAGWELVEARKNNLLHSIRVNKTWVRGKYLLI